MKPLQLNVMIARYPYGGNGATSSESPSVTDWLVETVIKMKSDQRIDLVMPWKKSDTPIPMVRNDSVADAKKSAADLLLMIDSDMNPDHERGLDTEFKPFWDSSFDFLYERYKKDLLTVVGAPYCGPPEIENPYVFRWTNHESNTPNADWRITGFSREEAAMRGGFEEVAALPTGLILFDMRVFDLVEPPYFYYEYEGEGEPCPHCGLRKPGMQARKSSTEDVTATRDIAMHGQMKLGYSPIFCNWHSWAGHWKPKCVGKPRLLTGDMISKKYQEAVLSGRKQNERLTFVNFGNGQKKSLKNIKRK